MGNSSQVLIKKKKKQKRISLVTSSPLIYVFIHHKLGKLVSDYIYTELNLKDNLNIQKYLMFAFLNLFLHQTYTPSCTINTGSGLRQTSEPGKWNSLSFTLSLKAIQLYAGSDSPMLYRINTGIVCTFEVANTFISSLASTVRRGSRVMKSIKWWMDAGVVNKLMMFVIVLFVKLIPEQLESLQKRSFSTFAPPRFMLTGPI